MDKKVLQNDLDIKKWLESEKINRDLCGTYPFCEYCDKSLKFPCAEAYKLYMLDQEEESDEDEGKEKRVYQVLSFKEKLDKAKDETKEKYQELVKIFDEYGFKYKMFKRYVVVRYSGEIIAKVSITKNLLRLHMNLNPESFNEFKHYDFSEYKRYENTPYTIKFDNKKRCIKASKILLKIFVEE